MSEFLVVMADGVRMGTLERDGMCLGFTYDSTWLESPRRFPLSLSMPLALKEHPHSVIEPFLWGLLPDSPQILDEWGKRFHVSSRNVFSITCQSLAVHPDRKYQNEGGPGVREIAALLRDQSTNPASDVQ